MGSLSKAAKTKNMSTEECLLKNKGKKEKELFSVNCQSLSLKCLYTHCYEIKANFIMVVHSRSAAHTQDGQKTQFSCL